MSFAARLEKQLGRRVELGAVGSPSENSRLVFPSMHPMIFMFGNSDGKPKDNKDVHDPLHLLGRLI